MALDGNDAALVASFTSIFFYGIYVQVAFHCSKLVYAMHKAGRGHTYLTATHISLFVLINVRCIGSAARAINAWKYANVSRGFINVGGYSSPMSLLLNVVYVLVTLVADAFLVQPPFALPPSHAHFVYQIYRTSIVWRNSLKIMAVPVLVSLTDVASGIWWIYCLSVFSGIRGFPTDIVVSVTVFRVLTAVLNVMCTGLIAYRILSLNKGTSLDGSSARVITLIVESASIYTLISLCQIVTLTSNSFSVYIFTDLSVPVTGIVFSSIIIRVSQGRSLCDEYISNVSTELQWRAASTEHTANSFDNVTRPDILALPHSSHETTVQSSHSTTKAKRVPLDPAATSADPEK
ncbi:hypothetical protein BDZ89DRAFT_1155807 [Hymenopellis radicata]|nr:hypothetical protein BDZ89DRAFT_1155807 [Hymenopellis radicata]